MSSSFTRHFTSPLGLLVAVSILLLILNIATRSQTTAPPSALDSPSTRMSDNAAAPPILALNLCLLPPPSTTIYRLAHLLNGHMSRLDPQSFLYSATRHAHVTVVQFYIESARYEAFLGELRTLMGSDAVADFTPLRLTGVDIAPGPLQAGRYVPSLAITPTPQLAALHTRLLTLTQPYTVPSPPHNTHLQAAFYTDPSAPHIDQPTSDWVGRFRTDAAYGHYFPHVTLGTCGVDGLDEVTALKDGGVGGEAKWVVDRLYVFQLGNTGTVRKQLAEVTFG